MQIPATFRFDSRQMTANNSSRTNPIVDLEPKDNRSQTDYLSVRDASDNIASSSDLSLGLLTRSSEIAANAELTGDNGDNVLRGTDSADVLRGLGGNDRLFGRGRGDQLFGDAGNDTLFGESGNDTLFGGGNRDRLE